MTSEGEGVPSEPSSNRREVHPLAPAWLGLAGSLVVALIALSGVVLNGNYQLRVANEQQTRQSKDESARELRDLRRPIYEDYLTKANKFASAQSVRHAECKAGTDDPKLRGRVCTVDRASLQSTRYDLQRAINKMSTVESDEADRAAKRIAAAMPPTLVGSSGEPSEGPVDDDALQIAIEDFIAVQRCDTNPTAKC